MPAYNVTAPNGLSFNVNAPEGATPDDALGYAQRLYSSLDVTPDHVAEVESNNNPNAVNAKTGARGLMQVLPKVAADPGYGVDPAKDQSPAEYERVGRQLYSAFKTKYKDPFVAAAAYNWGPGNVDQWLHNGGDWKKLPKETYQYVQKLFNVAMKHSRIS